MKGSENAKIAGRPFLDKQFRVIIPESTTFSIKNLKNAVDFNSSEKWPSKNSWTRDIRSTHVRNRHLLDLPHSSPKCCCDIYNVVNDRQKLKKLQKYNLSRPVRKIVPGLEVERVGKRESEDCKSDAKITVFPECYELPGSESDERDEEDDEFRFCSSGSESECSGCSTVGHGTRRRIHRVFKINWRDYLPEEEIDPCRVKVSQAIRKHKEGE